MERKASAMGLTASAIERCVHPGGEISKRAVRKKPVKIGLPTPALDICAPSAEENARFLQLVTACAQVKTHYELFLLAQGELQFFLPHDILIAAWGDFSAQEPRFDVISNLPEVRTNHICNIVVPLAKRLHKMWDDSKYQPIMLNKSVAELQGCSHDGCGEPCAFHNMKLTLVHGTRNKRDGYDSMYIALRRHPAAINGAEVRLPSLVDAVINQIDIAYRKVSALQGTDAPANERTASTPSVLSVREEEITYWVCLGKTNGQIAQILGISVNTVKNHVQRVFDKLGANNRTHVVAKYRDMAESAESN